MPFRVKKRPNPLQSAMAGFMQGATQGAQYGLQQAMLKSQAEKDKDKEDRKTTVGLLQKTATKLYNPEQKAEVDKLIFDIGTGVKPISDAYAFMQGITPEAYVKPENKQTPPLERKLDQYETHVDKLYKQAIDPKNKDNIGYMSKEQYIEGFLDPQVKQHGANIKAELMQESGLKVPSSATGKVDFSLDQQKPPETPEETGGVLVDKTTGIKYKYIGGNRADPNSYRALN